jgi:selenide,water dikinase
MRNGAARVVLVGGGHAHLELLHAWASRPPRCELTLVSDPARALYSGMVPGLVAGEYAEAEIAIELAPLAARAGARFVCGRVERIDARERRIELAGGERLGFDLASLDVGSDVAGHDLPGVAEHAIATRPLAGFVRRIEAALEARREAGLRIVVVGAGAAGVELAFALERRASRAGGPRVTLVEAEAELLPGHGRRVARRVARRCEARGIERRLGVRVVGVEPGRLRLAAGAPIAFDLLVWAAGAAAPALFRRSGLPVDANGYLRVRATLQAETDDDLFAAGDGASIAGHADAAKAGVHAVRAGRVLAHNLRARLSGAPLRRFRPQRHFLSLLNLADGTALGTKWGFAAEGRCVRRLKDRIDRRWIERIRGGGLTGRTRD